MNMADELNVDPGTQSPTAEEAKAEPKSLQERLGAIYDEVTSKADAEETATDGTSATEETPPKADAKPTGSEVAAGEGDHAAPEKVEVTADQLADTKYWGALDADGWKRMERDYPVPTALVKAAQAAGSRIVNAKRKEATQPIETRTEAQQDDEPSPELLKAVEMTLSLDPKEAAKGHLTIARLTAPAVLKENGVDPSFERAKATIATAYEAAVTELPELDNIDQKELDDVLDGTSHLRMLVDIGTPETVTQAMIGAGQILIERKKSAAAVEAAKKTVAAAEKKATQKVVQSNANPATAAALASHGATPPGKLTIRERADAAYDREMARQGR